jgi:hypothetical protein
MFLIPDGFEGEHSIEDINLKFKYVIKAIPLKQTVLAITQKYICRILRKCK